MFRRWRKHCRKSGIAGIALLLLLSAVLPVAEAAAQQASHMDTPLVIVRFNQTRVYYQRPLYNAVSRALQAYPDVVFDIVSVVPVTGRSKTDEKWQAEAQGNTNAFVQEMQQMGVPANRIRVTYKESQAVESNEVHLFVN